MRLAFSFAAATLNFLPVWRTLLYAGEAESYFIATRHAYDHAAAIVLTLLLAGGVLAVLDAVRRLPGPWAGRGVLTLVGIVAIAPLNFARVAATEFGIGLQQAALVAGAAALLSLPFLFRLRERLAVSAFYAVALFAPLALVYLAQAGWGMASLSWERSPAARAAAATRSGGPRVVWIVFDELDGRLLRDPMGGFSYPEFENLAAGSIRATRVVPPGGGTIRAMPAYWLGAEVSDGHPVSAVELVVNVDGDDERRLTELDHVYRQVFERGHSIGIAGFYHPYCRMFGDFAQRCAEFSYRDVVHRESTGLLDSVRMDSVALLPVWRRIGGTRIYRGVREMALEMVADPELDFVTVHTNVPHDPPMYDPVARELTAIGRRATYPASILLADRMLGELRKAIAEAALDDRTFVIVTADHGWRRLPGYDSEPGAIPLFVSVPGQRAERVVDSEIEAVLLRDLILEVLDAKLLGVDDVESYLLSRSD